MKDKNIVGNACCNAGSIIFVWKDKNVLICIRCEKRTVIKTGGKKDVKT